MAAIRIATATGASAFQEMAMRNPSLGAIFFTRPFPTIRQWGAQGAPFARRAVPPRGSEPSLGRPGAGLMPREESEREDGALEHRRTPNRGAGQLLDSAGLRACGRDAGRGRSC